MARMSLEFAWINLGMWGKIRDDDDRQSKRNARAQLSHAIR